MSIIAISGKMQSGKNTVASIIQYLTLQKYYPNVWKDKSFDFFLDYGKSHTWKSDWKQVAFSSKLKQIVSILTGIPVEDLEKQEVKDRILGEEWNRYLLKEWWINDEYAEHEQFTYFASNEDMQKYISDMGHTDSTCSQVGKTSITVRQLLQEVGTDVMRNIIHPSIWVNALFADYREKVDFDNNLPMNKNWILTDLRFKNEKKAVEDRGGITIRVNRYNRNDYIVKSKKGGGVEHFRKHEHPSETDLDNELFTYTIDNNGSIEDLIESVKEILIKEKLI